jgi:hypothetical protein
VPDEEVQELGRVGVAIIKRWLEATTYLELPFDAYNHTPDCTVLHLKGKKKFDLRGHFLVGQKSPVIVECKRYRSTGGQYSEFLKFLCIAYSSELKNIEDFGRVRESTFIWVTFHPFNLENWAKFETRGQLKKALREFPEYLDGAEVDEDLVGAVAERVMVLVFNPKQEKLSLTRKELERIRPVLKRKAKSL